MVRSVTIREEPDEMDREGGRPPAVPPDGQLAATGLRHQALLCPDTAGCVDPVLAFVRDGIAHGEPVSVGVSAGLGGLLRQQLGAQPLVAFFDMVELGRNPSRIIPAMLDFAGAHASAALRFVSEPFWAGRSSAEYVEATRHEVLVDLAFADAAAAVLCVYNSGGLDAAALGCAEQTHPVVISGGQPRPSRRYAGHGVFPAECDHPLPPPPGTASRLSYSRDLRPVRAAVSECASQAGLAPGRIADLTLAASEVAANTLRHTQGDGILLVWRSRDEIVCQVTDSGTIKDPLAGRRRSDTAASGQGLWVVNQVCDLVEVRSGPAGTTVRMHLRL
jgi:anti-sigma regulatory factor (Ser/Thr protein kinase)